ncbi:MAG: ATP-dependent zinc metalloprotease FtsH [Bacilli bacterium]|nr:ATP-dependent zinc metalloprotease FtsH [Bacilli bacterium]MDD4406516.1 ATP-dependent zinc metalloprotease FtsH [Bacilli bacterium]
MKNKNYQRQTIPYIILFMVIISVMIFYNLSKYKVNEFTYNEFITQLSKGTVEKIEITEKTRAGVYFVTGKLKKYSEMESFKVNVPLSEPVLEKILVYITEDEIEMVTSPNPENSSFVTILVNIIPTLLLIGVMIWLFTKIGGSNKNSMDFGRSRAKLNEEGGTVKFTDVAGLVEEKQEVSELIDFLKHPKKFQKLGARIPKGVLLVGPPGTGKTLLAKAVAGEANVPFYYISGSDFVELFVGVGASRVRDMFKQAKQTAPCLIFIDEIDAVGRQRGTGLGGGHDEREQTLNQLLTEMDGFGVNEGIIIIAATNRPDVLDPALLRPGRFDRQVTVSLPDQKEREAILGVHARGKIFDKSVNLENLSKRTPGFSGADLENLLNEAALLAVRRDLSSISMNEIDEATDRVLMGPAKESRKITDKEKRLIAIHESGHAVIGIKLEYANEVHKITIIPRGHAGGYTMMLPKEEKFAVMTKDELLASITSLLSGRVAEELFLGQITTGASDDFKKATSIARSMVTEYGMSDLGPVQFEHKSEGVFLGRDYNKSRNFSDTVALEIDQEIRKIIDFCYKKASKIIKQNEDLVMLLTDTLMEKETLTREEINELVETGKLSGLNNPNDLKAQAKKYGIKGYTKMTEEELIKTIDSVKSKKDTN